MQFPSNVYNPIFDALRLVHNRIQFHEQRLREFGKKATHDKTARFPALTF